MLKKCYIGFVDEDKPIIFEFLVAYLQKKNPYK